jgi:uncharacterized integral membrane protein
VTIFSVQNAMPVAISFLLWRFDASLAIVIFLSVLCGILIGAVIASLLRIKSQARKEEKSESQYKTTIKKE